MDDADLLGRLVALGVTLAASVSDVRERRIPNRLVLVGLVTTIALVAVGGRWADALAGGGLGIALLSLPRLATHEAVGIGDIKLVGIVGLAVGASGVIAVVGLAVAAAAVALFVHAGCRRAAQSVRLPFAPCLAMGVAGYLAVTFHVGGG